MPDEVVMLGIKLALVAKLAVVAAVPCIMGVIAEFERALASLRAARKSRGTCKFASGVILCAIHGAVRAGEIGGPR